MGYLYRTLTPALKIAPEGHLVFARSPVVRDGYFQELLTKERKIIGGQDSNLHDFAFGLIFVGRSFPTYASTCECTDLPYHHLSPTPRFRHRQITLQTTQLHCHTLYQTESLPQRPVLRLRP